MEWYIWLLLVVMLIGVVAIFKRRATDGELIIDTSNPDKDIYRLELGNELENLGRKKTITFKIVHGAISQEKHTL